MSPELAFSSPSSGGGVGEADGGGGDAVRPLRHAAHGLPPPNAAEETPARPRLGFLGVGWIGRSRMQAMIETGAVDAAAVFEPAEAMRAAALELAPGAEAVDGFDALLAADLDGLVIATPSALHAEQSIRALEAGLAVFCQKPLGRSAEEVERVLAAARAADRRLGVDLSYRFTAAMQAVRAVVRSGALGQVFAADLTFHNAYGPDKPWFYDPRLSGGGCVMDLGVHLVDLMLWTLDFPQVTGAVSRLFSGGRPLIDRTDTVEDYATARLDLATGAVANLACSWRLNAGCEAVISAAFYGTDGGVRLRNLNGSFYDFVAERLDGTQLQTLAEPPDAWSGRAAAHWAEQLARSPAYDPEADRLNDVADVLDLIYAAA